jgi:uncharacterized phage protein (TIGR02218 family)
VTFGPIESSRADGEPVNLYLFKGTDNLGGSIIGPFGYTDAEKPITFEGVTYQPVPIDRDSITSAGTLDQTTIEVKMPQDTDIGNVFISWAPSQVVSLFIRQGNLSDPDAQFLVCWTGRVLGFEKVGSEITFTCEPIATSIRRPGLRRRYQKGCPHVLYGPQCGASKPDATNDATVNTVFNSEAVRLDVGWNALSAGADYRGGLIQWTDGNGVALVRTILRVNVNTLTLNGPPTSLIVGQTVSVSLGCNHLMTGCTLHDNIQNYGGQPWIPTVNPFRLVNNFG